MICSNSDDVNRAAESALVWASSSRNIFQRTALYPVSSNDGARAIATSTESRRRRLINIPQTLSIHTDLRRSWKVRSTPGCLYRKLDSRAPMVQSAEDRL